MIELLHAFRSGNKLFIYSLTHRRDDRETQLLYTPWGPDPLTKAKEYISFTKWATYESSRNKFRQHKLIQSNKTISNPIRKNQSNICACGYFR